MQSDKPTLYRYGAAHFGKSLKFSCGCEIKISTVFARGDTTCECGNNRVKFLGTEPPGASLLFHHWENGYSLTPKGEKAAKAWRDNQPEFPF